MEPGIQTLQDLIDKIIADDNVGAADSFNSAISAKVSDALDAKKFELAQSVYSNPVEPEEAPVEKPEEVSIEEPEVEEPEVQEELPQDEQE